MHGHVDLGPGKQKVSGHVRRWESKLIGGTMGTSLRWWTDELFRQHRRILRTGDRCFELPEKVQQQSAATAPTEISLRPTLYEPLTCASDLRRPLCLQMVRRRSTAADPWSREPRVTHGPNGEGHQRLSRRNLPAEQHLPRLSASLNPRCAASNLGTPRRA